MRFLGLVERNLGLVAMILLTAVAFLISADAILRKFGLPVPGTFEIARFSMVLIIFFGLARAQALGKHISVEILTERLPRVPRSVLEIVATLITALVWLCVVAGAWVFFYNSWRIKDFEQGGFFDVPYWIVKLPLFIGAVVFEARILYDLGRQLIHPRKATAEMVHQQ